MRNPKHTNRLINETSPYLQQHAHNPVDWFAWGEEAFSKSRSEDKPILLSIGYSACHWCHVMEHESFEDEETARLMNENFVNIKLDMEERPDVDKIYMNFVQLTTGSGGWPLNVFLTPDRLPFFGGTYFPPVNRYNMPSFRQILTGVADAWQNKRDELLASANDILDEIKRSSIADFGTAPITPDLLDSAFAALTRSFDPVNGGFGGAPKFPSSMAMEFLLRYYHRTKDENALEMVTKTCTKMANGGIFDQLGGGFHRYTVDAIWLTPHFEKMLYDNAQLIKVYLHVYQITSDTFYKDVAVQTLEYVKREMLDISGAFYSTQDADSEGVEGKFFVWTPAEVADILGEQQAKIFAYFYDVTEHGNFEEKNILNVKVSAADAAAKFEISEDELRFSLADARAKLFSEREKRVKPFRDEKVLTAWNGLMLSAFAEAAAILNDDDYLNIARANADFVLNKLLRDGYLLRTFKDGQSKLNAYLEDYANFADGLIDLFQVSGDIKYLEAARRFADTLITEFWDEENGGFYFTAANHEELLVRSKDYYDNATPSGNSAGADVLLKLSRLLGNDSYQRFATTVLRLIAPQIKRYPHGFGRALSVGEFSLEGGKEIVMIGKSRELAAEIWANYLPRKVVAVSESVSDETIRFIPLLEGRTKIDGKPSVYVCENSVCQRPVNTVEELRKQLLR